MSHDPFYMNIEEGSLKGLLFLFTKWFQNWFQKSVAGYCHMIYNMFCKELKKIFLVQMLQYTETLNGEPKH